MGLRTTRQHAKQAVPSKEERQFHLAGWELDCERLCVLENGFTLTGPL